MNQLLSQLLLADGSAGWEIAKLLIAGAVGFVAGIFKDKCTADKRKLTCKASYCPAGDATEFRYMISHVGNVSAENVRMRICCSGGGTISSFCFLVDEQVKCDRMTLHDANSNVSVSCTWSYINPGDDLELILFIDGCTDPDGVALEIDGKATKIARKKLTMQCGC